MDTSETNAVADYVAEVARLAKTGKATEHTFRGALADLLDALASGLRAVNEPKRTDCGAPDYIVQNKAGLGIFYVEAKDLGDDDLDGKKRAGHKEQFDRYKAALDTIIFTDYLDFHLYRRGQFVTAVRIAELGGPRSGAAMDARERVPPVRIVPLSENYSALVQLVADAASGIPQRIDGAKRLAELMAGKARMLQTAALRYLKPLAEAWDSAKDDEARPRKTPLLDMMLDMRMMLMPAVGAEEFSDIFAQTLTYGMFAARLNDPTPEDFSRAEAMMLIPKSNPFLKKLFGFIASDLEDELTWIVDDLADLFRASNVADIMRDYGKAQGGADPMLHFYEDFLAAYDGALRKKRGVWYTPIQVVRFIVAAADWVLRTRFGFPDGLADSSKTEIEVEETAFHGRKLAKKVKKTVHRVQLLDPATGTGTFIAEAVRQVHAKFSGNEGMWPGYVEKDLLPRLNGFELLMASYTMAHVKLDFVLRETGTAPSGKERFRVFLTDSLSDWHKELPGGLFASVLGAEQEGADEVKRDIPVMVIVGNPPYSGVSQNNSEWIMRLMDDYKVEPGGKQRLQERKNWLNDDYVKFIRLAEHYVEKNGEGIVAYITPHGFLDNPTFRGMRWHLMQTFGEIWTLNLHGNSKKKEVAPDGGKDECVFDIMQGVAITLFVKKATAAVAGRPPYRGGESVGSRVPRDRGGRAASPLAAANCRIYYADLWGKKKDKLAALDNATMDSIEWQEIAPVEPLLLFAPRDTAGEREYLQGFRIDEMMVVNTSGFVTANDTLNISFTVEEQIDKIYELKVLPEQDWRHKTGRSKDSRDWRYVTAKADALVNDLEPMRACYRPFDDRYTVYTGNSRGLYSSPQRNVMENLIQGDNLALCCIRICSRDDDLPVFVTDKITDKTILSSKDNANVFPLYLYEENMGKLERRANLDKDIVAKIAAAVSGGQSSIDAIRDFLCGEPVATLTGHEFEGIVGHRAIRDAIYAGYERVNYVARNAQLGEVRLTKSGITDSMAHGFGRAKLSAFAAIPEMIERGLIVQHNANWKGRGYESFVLAAPILIGGEQYCAFVVVNSTKKEGCRFYLHEVGRIADIKKMAEGLRSGSSGDKPALSRTLGDIKNLAYSLWGVNGGLGKTSSPVPIDIFDYCYGVLHSPVYRKKFKEFLKVDFPRIPYPKDAAEFVRFRDAGRALRAAHLMRDAAPPLSEPAARFPVLGDNVIDSVRFEILTRSHRDTEEASVPPSLCASVLKQNGRVWINSTQYFDNVPLVAWEQQIGGYRPADKWLKDRKGRALTQDDLRHYQRIILALRRTSEIMDELDDAEESTRTSLTSL